MPEDYIGYITDHINHERSMNSAMHTLHPEMKHSIDAKRYDMTVATILQAYLENAHDEGFLSMFAIVGIGALEESILKELGVEVSFHEAKKIGWAIHGLWKDGNTSGLEWLKKYSERLMSGEKNENNGA